MSRKISVLLTLLERNEPLARQLGEEISRLGADVQAHFWNDRPDAQVLAQMVKELCSPDLNAWVIAGSMNSFSTETMSALSLLAIAARNAREQTDAAELAVVISPSGVASLRLPKPLANAKVVSTGLGGRVIAAAATAKPYDPLPYRLNFLPLHGLGMWLEAGPTRDPWDGVLLGTRGCSPDAHGVGQSGIIPLRCTLKYPVTGMKIEASSGTFTAWGIANILTPAESYFTRLDGLPETIMFGPFPKGDDPDLYVLDLC